MIRAGISAVFLFVALGPWPVTQASAAQLYECVAQKRLAGREEPSVESAQSRLPDGQLRYLEKGDPGYASFAEAEPLPDWIGLFGAQNGHASSFLGFYRSKDFRCKKIEG